MSVRAIRSASKAAALSPGRSLPFLSNKARSPHLIWKWWRRTEMPGSWDCKQLLKRHCAATRRASQALSGQSCSRGAGGRLAVPRLPLPQRQFQHLLMQVCEPQDVRLPRGVASERKLLPKVLPGRRGSARSLKPGEFIAVARFDVGQHRQLVLDRWLQVGWISQV